MISGFITEEPDLHYNAWILHLLSKDFLYFQDENFT